MSKNVVRSGRPSATALHVAIVRAAHRLLDDPIIFDDPVALRILGAETEASVRADPFAYNDPLSRGLRASLIARSKVAEDELARAVSAGVRQYVVLGAGLDTFAYRNPHRSAGLRVFEVDHPSTQAWKRESLASSGIEVPEDLTFVPVDFENGTLEDGLSAAGFNFAAPAHVSWLGVTIYLTEAAVFDTLRSVASLAKGSSIVFDYRVPPHQLNPVERVITEQVMQRVASMGEPWLAAFEPEHLRRHMLDAGFARVLALGPDDLNPRYFFHRKDGLSTRARLMCGWL